MSNSDLRCDECGVTFTTAQDKEQHIKLALVGSESGVEVPYYAAWVAILIDYLEIPVIVDLFYRTIIKGERR